MKLRFYQEDVVLKQWDSRYDEWVYPRVRGQKVLQSFNEDTGEWETIPLVVSEIHE